MKKEYIEPATEVVAIAPCTLMQGSQTNMDIDPTKPPVTDDDGNYVKGDRGGDWDMDW